MTLPRAVLVLIFATSACVSVDDGTTGPPLADPEGKADGAWAAVHTLDAEREYALSPDGYTLFTTPGGGIPVVQVRAASAIPAWRWTGTAWTKLDLSAGREVSLDARAALYLSVGPTTGSLRIGLDHDAMYWTDVGDPPALGDADVDGNGVVDTADVAAAAAAVIPLGGVDAAFVKAALAGTQPTVIAADGFAGRVELVGLGLAVGGKVEIDGEVHTIGALGATATGMGAATIWIEGAPPAHGAWVELVGATRRVGRPLQALDGAPPVVIPEPSRSIVEVGPGDAPANRPVEPSACCLKAIRFSNPRGNPIRLYAFEQSGRPAGNNGARLAPGKRVTLTADCPVIELVVHELRGGEEVLAGRVTLRCDQITRRVYVEELPPAPPGGSQVRAQPLIEIVDFAKGSCPDQATPAWATGVRQGTIAHDNTTEWAHGEPGSGALVQFNAPFDALTPQGCKRWCWVQTAETTLELQPAGTDTWTVLLDTDPHNDNLDTGDKQLLDRRTGKTRVAPWYCYPYQEIRADGRQIMADGPHIKHTDRIPIDAVPDHDVRLAAGDVIKRTSRFRTSMMCYDPRPARAYNSYTWSLTTLYRHPTGASSVVSGPDASPMNPGDPHVGATLDQAELERHIEKRDERDR